MSVIDPSFNVPTQVKTLMALNTATSIESTPNAPASKVLIPATNV